MDPVSDAVRVALAEAILVETALHLLGLGAPFARYRHPSGHVLVRSGPEGKACGYDYVVAVFILCSEVDACGLFNRVVSATYNREIHFSLSNTAPDPFLRQ